MSAFAGHLCEQMQGLLRCHRSTPVLSHAPGMFMSANPSNLYTETYTLLMFTMELKCSCPSAQSDSSAPAHQVACDRYEITTLIASQMVERFCQQAPEILLAERGPDWVQMLACTWWRLDPSQSWHVQSDSFN